MECAVIWSVVALGALLAVLFLAVLGAMRETVRLRGEVNVLADLVRNPPAPSYVGGRAPDALVRALESLDGPGANGLRAVAFVSPGCAPCEELVEGLAIAIDETEITPDELVFAIWAASPEHAEQFAPRIPSPFVLDGTGLLSRACEIRATPTVLMVSQDDYNVVEYSLEGDTQWVINRLRSLRPLAAA